jgi:hypothetical protein
VWKKTPSAANGVQGVDLSNVKLSNIELCRITLS